MDKQQLNSLLVSDSTPSAEALQLLNSCLDEHPHFVAAHALRLALLRTAAPNQLPEALGRVAFLLPNRKHLHALLAERPRSEAEAQSLELLPDDIVIPRTKGRLRASTDDILELIAEQPSTTDCPSTDNLIDQFLNNLPNIQRPTPPSPLDEQPENVDISAQSVAETGEAISEQLAQILTQQGHTNRALEIYRQLMLKYPEKSAYFAAQMDCINKSLNN